MSSAVGAMLPPPTEESVVYYYVPQDSDAADPPNAFVVRKPLRSLTLADIREHFPLPGRYHFRFQYWHNARLVWLDPASEASKPPVSGGGTIMMKVVRMNWMKSAADSDGIEWTGILANESAGEENNAAQSMSAAKPVESESVPQAVKEMPAPVKTVEVVPQVKEELKGKKEVKKQDLEEAKEIHKPGSLPIETAPIVTFSNGQTIPLIDMIKQVQNQLRKDNLEQQKQATIPSSTSLATSAVWDTRPISEPIKTTYVNKTQVLSQVTHYYAVVKTLAEKFNILSNLYAKVHHKQLIIFRNDPNGVKNLSNAMAQKGVDVCAVHRNMGMPFATSVINDFNNGKHLIIVSTDDFTPYISVSGASHIINYDVSTSIAKYKMRMMGSDTAGKRISIINFFTGKEEDRYTQIQQQYGITLVHFISYA